MLSHNKYTKTEEPSDENSHKRRFISSIEECRPLKDEQGRDEIIRLKVTVGEGGQPAIFTMLKDEVIKEDAAEKKKLIEQKTNQPPKLSPTADETWSTPRTKADDMVSSGLCKAKVEEFVLHN